MSENAAFEETIANQTRAASPAVSAFVSANAGSGKTRVLTTRVARLLLSGVAPSRLLCITFTKAAAAEMADRLFTLLGEWSLADDAALAEALSAIGAPLIDITPPTNEKAALARARRLFAKALETPGGLKIQTIHAFCETVLKRFPLEAGVAPGFSVIEDADALRLQNEAVDRVLAATDRDDENEKALRRLADTRAPGSIRALLLSAINDAKRRTRLSADDFPERLAEALGVSANTEPHDLIADLDNHIDASAIAGLAGALLVGGKKAQGFGEALSVYDKTAQSAERFALLQEVFFTQKGSPRAKLLDKAAKTAAPQAEALEESLRAAINAFVDAVRAATILQDTLALARLVSAGAAGYEKAKAGRAGLDFDDLIDKTRALFADSNRADWVMYKLDQGVDHILLDEAQDTSPEAWRVIEAPLREFFSGAGARGNDGGGDGRGDGDGGHRTFFAVGDQKQSIYSFQGADAALFEEKAQDLGAQISAAAPFANVPLRLSFRTSAPVLEFVDALFADETVLDGVSVDKPLTHGVFRDEAPGLVELWPLTPRPERADLKPWDAPLNALTAESPERKLASAIARRIKDWLDTGETLEPGRPLRAGDVMILVQSRGALFREMIKALSQTGVPAAGADRLTLMDDQAVKDLFSFARAVLFDGDDLSLAETLKSPFFNYSDESLFDLAYGRKGALATALRSRAKEEPRAAAILEDMSAAAHVARTEGPFGFFTHLLETGAPSGRKRLLKRLGEPARDPLNALLGLALDFEQSHPRSLTQFLLWAERRGADVTRDAENASDVVRVMTAHKSKGLEAPVVFLLDAHRRRTRAEPFLDLGPRGAALPIAAPAGGADCQASADARTRAKRLDSEEYRRLLYVAATRARDRLYICGVEDGRGGDPHAPPPAEKSWRALAEDAFGRLEADGANIETDTLWDRPILRYEKRSPVETAGDSGIASPTTNPTPTTTTPAFLERLAPEEKPAKRLQPSRLADRFEADETDASPLDRQRETLPISPAERPDALLRGRCLHRLLEISSANAGPEWTPRADRLLAALAPATSLETRAAWREEAAAVLNDPTFKDVFGPAALAEAAIGGKLENGVQLSGQIDRLLINPDEILIVDFKTNRPPPRRAEDAPTAYLAQMGAYAALMAAVYPGRKIRTALLWTFEARLMELPENLTASALKRTLA
ncbi:MAG: double-strand break repair helicase AddA [Pseudomonadota bacterium]